MDVPTGTLQFFLHYLQNLTASAYENNIAVVVFVTCFHISLIQNNIAVLVTQSAFIK